MPVLFQPFSVSFLLFLFTISPVPVPLQAYRDRDRSSPRHKVRPHIIQSPSERQSTQEESIVKLYIVVYVIVGVGKRVKGMLGTITVVISNRVHGENVSTVGITLGR